MSVRTGEIKKVLDEGSVDARIVVKFDSSEVWVYRVQNWHLPIRGLLDSKIWCTNEEMFIDDCMIATLRRQRMTLIEKVGEHGSRCTTKSA